MAPYGSHPAPSGKNGHFARGLKGYMAVYGSILQPYGRLNGNFLNVWQPLGLLHRLTVFLGAPGKTIFMKS